MQYLARLELHVHIILSKLALKLVYQMKFVRSSEFRWVSSMPEIKSTTIHFYEDFRESHYYMSCDTQGKCIVVVLICSGMGGMIFKVWFLTPSQS